MIKVVHYINQFFAQIGGEEKAHIPAERHDGEVMGPEQLSKQLSKMKQRLFLQSYVVTLTSTKILKKQKQQF